MTIGLIQILTAFTGSLAFAVIFHVEIQYLMPAALGGALSWSLYLLAAELGGQVFYPILLVSAVVTLYAEGAAKLLKAPAILFLIPTLVPLIPGSSLYYAMGALVQRDWATAAAKGILTLQWVLGIAAGTSIVAVWMKIQARIQARFFKN